MEDERAREVPDFQLRRRCGTGRLFVEPRRGSASERGSKPRKEHLGTNAKENENPLHCDHFDTKRH